MGWNDSDFQCAVATCPDTPRAIAKWLSTPAVASGADPGKARNWTSEKQPKTTCTINEVISMGRRNTQLRPTFIEKEMKACGQQVIRRWPRSGTEASQRISNWSSCQRKVEMSGFSPDRNVGFHGLLQGARQAHGIWVCFRFWVWFSVPQVLEAVGRKDVGQALSPRHICSVFVFTNDLRGDCLTGG